MIPQISKCNIYLDGFPYETTEEDIYTFFSDIRDHITNLHMPKYFFTFILRFLLDTKIVVEVAAMPTFF